MDEQKQDDKQEPTYNKSVPIRNVALKTYWKQWTIEGGGRRGSEISVLMAWHDDNDDDDIYRGIRGFMPFLKVLVWKWM